MYKYLLFLLLFTGATFAESTYLENWFGGNWGNIIGDPLVSGLILMGFFSIFVMLQDTRLDGKLAIMVPACILASFFTPIFTLIAIFMVSGVMYLALTKFTNR